MTTTRTQWRAKQTGEQCPWFYFTACDWQGDFLSLKFFVRKIWYHKRKHWAVSQSCCMPQCILTTMWWYKHSSKIIWSLMLTLRFKIQSVCRWQVHVQTLYWANSEKEDDVSCSAAGIHSLPVVSLNRRCLHKLYNKHWAVKMSKRAHRDDVKCGLASQGFM